MSDIVRYSMSQGGPLNGKSVCLWRTYKGRGAKVARFQNDEVARMFAEEFDFPLDSKLADRLAKKGEGK